MPPVNSVNPVKPADTDRTVAVDKLEAIVVGAAGMGAPWFRVDRRDRD